MSALIYDFYVPTKQLDRYHWLNISCQRKKDGLVVPDGLCSFKQLENLNERDNCTGQQCDEGYWEYSEWSSVSFLYRNIISFLFYSKLYVKNYIQFCFQCSASCGNGTRTRNISCNSRNKASSPYSCNYYQIPDTVEICNTKSCDDDELTKVWNVVSIS